MVRLSMTPKLSPEQEAEEQRIAKDLREFDFIPPTKEENVTTETTTEAPENGKLAALGVTPEQLEPRLKYLTFGPHGSYKTRGALEIAKLIGGGIWVIDVEKGAAPYAKEFGFTSQKKMDSDGITETLQALCEGGHGYRTLIVDGMTPLYQRWLEEWEKRFLLKNSGRSGHRGEWYEMNQKDWSPVKRSWFTFIRSLFAVDMNVFVVSHEKDEYEGTGENVKKTGQVIPDCEKHIINPFDVVLFQRALRTGKFTARTEKDRTGRLPPMGKPWDFSSQMIVDAFGASVLAREVKKTRPDSNLIAEIRKLGNSLGLSNIAQDELARAKYGAASVEELAPADAATVADKLRRQAEQKNGSDKKE